MAGDFIRSIGFPVMVIVIAFGFAVFQTFFSKKKDKLDYGDRIIMIALTISYAAPAVAYIALLYVKIFMAPEMIPLGHIDDWISFLGAVLGGFITIFAVAITIRHQERIAKEALEEEKKKYELLALQQKRDEKIKLFPYVAMVLKDDSSSQVDFLRIHIRNISNNSIRNLKLTNVSFEHHAFWLSEKAFVPSFLPQGSQVEINVPMYSKRQFESSNEQFQIMFFFEYYDLLLNGPYKYTVFVQYVGNHLKCEKDSVRLSLYCNTEYKILVSETEPNFDK